MDSEGSGSQVKSPGDVLCDVCLDADEKAVRTCQTCRASYCEKHLRRHKTSPDLQGHILLEPAGQQIPAPDKVHVVSMDSTSATISWSHPDGMDQTKHKYQVSYQCPGRDLLTTTTSSPSISLSDLQPASQYTVSVRIKMEKGDTSLPVTTTFTTTWGLTTISWSHPDGMDQTQTKHKYQVSYQCPGRDLLTTTTSSPSISLSDLQPASRYTVSVSTEMENGDTGQPVTTTFTTKIPAPVQLKADSVDTTSATVSWREPDGMDTIQYHYQVTYTGPGEKEHIVTASSPSISLSDLQPASRYTVSVRTKMENGDTSRPVTTTFNTIVPAPDKLIVDSVMSSQATVSWNLPHGIGQTPFHYQVSYQCSKMEEPIVKKITTSSVKLSDLHSGLEYHVDVCTISENDEKSQPVSTTFKTIVPAPDKLIVDSVTSSQATVSWNMTHGIGQTPFHYQVSYQCSKMEEPIVKKIPTSSVKLSDLHSGLVYNVEVCTISENDEKSQPVSTKFKTIVPAPDKLIVDSVTSSQATVSWNMTHGIGQTPFHYQVSYQCSKMEEPIVKKIPTSSVKLSDLHSGLVYNVEVCTISENGEKSQTVSTKFKTIVPAPDKLIVDSVTSSQATVSWNMTHGIGQTPFHYQVSYQCSKMEEPIVKKIPTSSVKLSDLHSGLVYNVEVCTISENDEKSQPVSTKFKTIVPAPDKLIVDSVTSSQATVSWNMTHGIGQTPFHYQVSYQCSKMEEPIVKKIPTSSVKLSDLHSGLVYNVEVCTISENDEKSQPVSTKFKTIVPAPDKLIVDSVTSSQATVSWNMTHGIGQTPFHYQVSYQCSKMEEPIVKKIPTSSVKLSDLHSGLVYNVEVCTISENDEKSQPVSTKFKTIVPAPDKLIVDSVTSSQATVSWNMTHGIGQTPFHYQVSYQCSKMEEPIVKKIPTSSVKLSDLHSGLVYNVEVCTISENDEKSQPVSTKFKTIVPAPDKLIVDSVTSSQATVSWNMTHGIGQTPFHYQVSYQCSKMEEPIVKKIPTSSVKLSDLHSGLVYNVEVCTISENDEKSQPVSTKFKTIVPAPDKLIVDSVTSSQATVSWNMTHGIGQTPFHYQVSYQCSKMEEPIVKKIPTSSVKLSDLHSGLVYNVEVCTISENDEKSQPVSTKFKTIVPAPDKLIVDSVTSSQATVSWNMTHGIGQTPFHYQVSYQCSKMEEPIVKKIPTSSVKLSDLHSGLVYNVEVCTISENDEKSQPVSTKFKTIVPAPDKLIVDSVTSSQATVSWNMTHGIGQTPFHYQVSYQCSKMEEPIVKKIPTSSVKLSDLHSGLVYNVEVCTISENDEKSQPVSTKFKTIVPAPDKLIVDSVTSSQATVSWNMTHGIGQTPFHYQVSYQCSKMEEPIVKKIPTSSVKLSDLHSGLVYNVEVCTISENDEKSQPVSTKFKTIVPAPDKLIVDSVTSSQATVSWNMTHGIGQTPFHYQVSYQCSKMEEPIVKKIPTSSVKLSDLHSGLVYNVEVCTISENDEKSQPVSTKFKTIVPAPDKLIVDSVTSSQATVSWNMTHGIGQTPFHYQVSYQCSKMEEPIVKKIPTSSVKLSDLHSGLVYNVEVCTISENDEKSQPVSTKFKTIVPAPDKLIVDSVTSSQATVSWNMTHGIGQTPFHYQVSYQCSKMEEPIVKKIPTSSVKLSDLHSGLVYNVEVCTISENDEKSQPVSTKFKTIVPAPDKLIVDSVTSSQATVSWNMTHGIGQTPFHYQVSYQCSKMEEPIVKKIPTASVKLSDLHSGLVYNVEVCTISENGEKSQPVSTKFKTIVPAPDKLIVDSVTSSQATVSWNLPNGIGQTPFHYQVSYQCSKMEEPIVKKIPTSSVKLSDLHSGLVYHVDVRTISENGEKSQPVSTTFKTKPSLKSCLERLGLEQLFSKKLSLNTTLALNRQTLEENQAPTLQTLVLCFLRELMRVNAAARDVMCSLSDEKDHVNPLDLIVSLFLCSDPFLQQEIALKMSMCQFAVPLLLPNCDTKKCTLMQWSLRDIVKRFRPHSMAEQRGFVENSIVLTDLPVVSFVRLGESSLSKSQLLNEVLSKSQQINNTFVHHNMTGGNQSRMIADGLVEISWYLPCGKESIDVFPEALAVANLRGDLQNFEAQFSFLQETSAAIFVFCDDLAISGSLLSLPHQAKLFIVSNTEDKGYNAASFEKTQIPASQMIKKDRQMNNAQLVKKLCSVITEVMSTKPHTCSVEKMSQVARDIGISVDDESCQDAYTKANLITTSISKTSDFKEKCLPLQGNLLSEIAKLEREECTCKDAGEENIEQYKSKLRKQKKDLRKRQVEEGQNGIVVKFIDYLREHEGQQRSFFLKWSKMNLDNLSRTHLSHLKDQYKKLCKASTDRKALADLDTVISNNSLGIEHFLREIGQIYESALTLPQNSATQKNVQDLPKICAQLMLDGFPLELMDGDSSNIPIQWIEEVLKEIHSLTKSQSKIRVITVLGVQSSGKSTLLNTMFGVQFAVSSGRCTRGAFMQLIRVEEDLKKMLGCNFLMIIDTEGLKAPELAQLADSYEHDNELATLVIGLSDVTIINIAIENATEMKDILQIVVHAFLRMKEVGKKPLCLFVHQNVPDVAAHAKNASGRNIFVQQLDEMTGIAARMEKKEGNKRFTDIMVYDPEKDSFYLPGLWHGNPPMAPVNTGYSEAVTMLKRSIIQKLADLNTPVYSVIDFLDWTQSLWNAVKYDNFIFSFRNCLEADAYNSLSQEFSKWDRDFRKHMQGWWQKAETEISNHGREVCSSPGLQELKVYLRGECTDQLAGQKTKILQKVQEYFEKAKNHVQLVEKYKENFINSANMLNTETNNSLMNKLESAVEKKQNMNKIDDLKKSQSAIIEKQVVNLLAACRDKRDRMSDKQLEEEFEQTWNETVHSLSIKGLDKRDINEEMLRQLRKHPVYRGGHANKLVSNIGSLKNKAISVSQVETSTDHETLLAIFKKYVWNNQNKKEEEMKRCEREQMAANIIQKCEEFVDDKVTKESDYQAIYSNDLLQTIDDGLNRQHSWGINADFEAHLKIEIFRMAAGKFQRLHDAFLEKNDPLKCLEKYKPLYLADLKDQYKETDQCERKAEEFTDHCLKPAVEEYVNKSLWPAIEHALIESKEGFKFQTRTFFQFSILKQLLEDDKFEQFVNYSITYETFAEAWILKEIEKFASQDKHTIAELEVKSLGEITDKVEEAIRSSEVEKTDVCSFINIICQKLNKELVIPTDALNAVIHWNTAETKPFSERLKQCVSKMKQSLGEKFYAETNVKKQLAKLPLKSHDELFKRLFGCGHQCPFCKSPCELGESHTEHFTTLHRPEGLGTYHWVKSQKLVFDLCTTSVTREARFRCSATKGEDHPYKEYKQIYPDWRIQPDPSEEASDYWKYVFAKYNKEFAKEYDAQPADLPSGWREISQDQALKSLTKVYRL